MNKNWNKYAAPEHKADREFLLEAVNQNGNSFLHGVSEPKADREFLLEAVNENGTAVLAWGCLG